MPGYQDGFLGTRPMSAIETFLSVKAFGTVGNGVADDTAAIQAAITAAAAIAVVSNSLGATVYFPPGTYKISSALSISSSSLSFVGAGFRSSIIKQVTAGAHGFSATDKRELVFRDLQIVGQGTGTADGIHLAATGSTALFDCVFENLEIQSFGQHGLYVDDLCTSVITHVRIQTCGADGFHLTDNGGNAFGGTSVALTACYANACAGNGYYTRNLKYSAFVGCATDGCNVGYMVVKGSGLVFTGCGCELTSGADGHGFWMSDNSVAIHLQGCWAMDIAATTGVGFLVSANGGGNCSRIVFTACRVSGSTAQLASFKVDANNEALFESCYPKTLGDAVIVAGAEAGFRSHSNLNKSAVGQEPLAAYEYDTWWGGGATTKLLGLAVKADAARRFTVRADGRLEWGDGTAAADTNFYRAAADALQTDDVLTLLKAVTGSRPSAATVGAGAQMYDTTLSKPIWSNGTVWKDAAGTTV